MVLPVAYVLLVVIVQRVQKLHRPVLLELTESREEQAQVQIVKHVILGK